MIQSLNTYYPVHIHAFFLIANLVTINLSSNSVCFKLPVMSI